VDPFVVRSTFIKGKPVFRDGMVAAGLPVIEPLNAFYAREIVPADIEISGQSGLYRVIRVYDGELLTGSETANLLEIDGIVQGDIGRDILKIVVINRYHPSKPSVGWITGFGIGRGAIASSIAHDSHNIIAVGCSDSEIAEAVNQVIRNQGGISVSEKNQSQTLPLPVAGLMSMLEVEEVGVKYAGMTETVRNLGSTLKAPFMALSFMALLVIPHLKIGDRGLFNCDNFEFTDLRAD
jgi:adenine deaminase